MTIRKLILAAATLAALGAPALASAQTSDQTWGGYGGSNAYDNGGYHNGYGGDGYDHRGGYGQGYGYGQGDYGRGDGGWRHRRFSGYPEFRGEERHIRGEIAQLMSDGAIDRGQAGELFGEVRNVQAREAREFRFHGWALPEDDRASIRAALDRLDGQVDQARDD